MSTSRSRYAPRVPRILSLAIFFVLTIAVSMAVAEKSGGSYELRQPGSSQPVAWAWTSDDPLDGLGVTYYAYLDEFAHPGPSHPMVVTSAAYVPQEFVDVEDFANWIVQNYPYVPSTDALSIFEHQITEVVLVD